jgi:integrase
MAKLYKRGNTYYSRIRIGGKEVRKPLSTNKDLAEERLGDLIKIRNATKHGHAPTNMSWQTFKKEYLEASKQAKDPKTWTSEVRAFREMEADCPVNKLAQITPQFLDLVKTKWLARGRGKYVINRDLRSIRTAMKKAEAYKYVSREDWTSNKYMKVPKGRLKFYTVPDLLLLKKVCHGAWLTILYLGARAGLRREEIRELTWSEVDFARNRIHIAPRDADGEVSAWTPKDYERRFIPMAPDLRAYLESIKNGSPYVFSDEGQRPTLGSMTSYFSRLVRKAKLKGSIHTLRHSFGAQLASAGVPPKAIQEMMGHSKSQTTDIYTHLIPGTAESSVNKLTSLN